MCSTFRVYTEIREWLRHKMLEMRKQFMLYPAGTSFEPRRSPIVSYSGRGRLTVHTVHTFVATNAIGGEDVRLLLYNFV